MTTQTDKLFIRPEEAFRRIGVGKTHGYKLIKEGVIPSVKLGRCRRIPVRALEEWARTLTDTE